MNILEYIKGSRKGKSAHEMEEKIMRDPFLAEAMEGYESVKGNHDAIIARLQQKVSKKSKRKKFKHPMFIWTTISSAVAIIAFIVVFYLGGFDRYFHKKNDAIVVTNNISSRKALPVIGFQAYEQYITKNKKLLEGKKGKVKLRFSTDRNGKPTNIKVVQKLTPEYDKQAIELIENGSKWTSDCQQVEYEIEF